VAFFNQFWGAFSFGVASASWLFAVLWGMERLFPKGQQVSGLKQLAVLRFWLFYLVAGALIATAFDMIKQAYDLKPLVSIPLQRSVVMSPYPWAIYVIGPITSMIIYDFFNYWMHRAQHKWFWRQHAVHHSIADLSAVNSFMHWTEELFRVAFVSLPTALLFDVHAGGITVASMMLVGAQGNFIHSASAINFGRYGRWFLADNRWHRIHHSANPAHFDRNFATSIPFWDVLFGTAHFPKPGEWPKTGLPEEQAPETIKEYLLRPFVSPATVYYDRGNAAVGTVKVAE
jgi:sterol desaturase/sphingolipid hydroxylase (fatty acid hydroxylase superfamily)